MLSVRKIGQYLKNTNIGKPKGQAARRALPVRKTEAIQIKDVVSNKNGKDLIRKIKEYLKNSKIGKSKVGQATRRALPVIKKEAKEIKDVYRLNKKGKGAGVMAVCKHAGIGGVTGFLVGALGLFSPFPTILTIGAGYFAGKRAEKGIVSLGSKLLKDLPKKFRKIV